MDTRLKEIEDRLSHKFALDLLEIDTKHSHQAKQFLKELRRLQEFVLSQQTVIEQQQEQLNNITRLMSV